MTRKFFPLFIFGVLVIIFVLVMIVAALFEGGGSILDDEEELEMVRSESVTESFQDQMRGKLNEMRLEELNLNKATIGESIEFLRLRTIELDEEAEPERGGIGFVVRGERTVGEGAGLEDALTLDEGLGGQIASNAQLVTLLAKDVGIAEALDLICAEAGLQWKVDEEILTIVISRGGESGGGR